MASDAFKSANLNEETSAELELGTSAQYAGAFFPGASGLSVTGGTFTSHVHIHHAAEAVSDGLRIIPRGDIALQREIRLHGDVVSRSRAQTTPLRRMFTAKVHGLASNSSVMLYQGERAREASREYIARFSGLWHPNIVQLFAVSRSPDALAVVAHDDLVPYLDFLALYRAWPMMQVYFPACWVEDFRDVTQAGVIGVVPTTNWIRRSTGRLCIDLEKAEIKGPRMFLPEATPIPAIQLIDLTNPENLMAQLTAFTFEAFHSMLYLTLGQSPGIDEWQLGSVCRRRRDDNGDELCTEIAHLAEEYPRGNIEWDIQTTGKTVGSGWIRFEVDQSIGAMFLSSHRFSWMSQANYVFKRLDITSSHDEYMCCEGLVISLRKTLKIPEDPSACPYLFICPPADPSTRQLSWYWSFDLQGSTRLTVEDAASHGLPVLEMDVNWYGHSWDASAYEGLRSFHSAKGFDPESQDLAIHLGHPLYQIVGDMAPETSRIEEVFDSQADDNTEDIVYVPTTEKSSNPLVDPEIEPVVATSWTWGIIEFSKLMLILMLAAISCYEYLRYPAALSTRRCRM